MMQTFNGNPSATNSGRAERLNNVVTIGERHGQRLSHSIRKFASDRRYDHDVGHTRLDSTYVVQQGARRVCIRFSAHVQVTVGEVICPRTARVSASSW